MSIRTVKNYSLTLMAIAIVLILGACDELIAVLDDNADTNSKSKSGSSSNSSTSIDATGSYENKGKCRHVVDGDSLYIAGQDTQIRLWGVDAPERDEPGYERAKQALVKLALKKNVYCATQDIDKYDRIVARCFLEDGKEINQALLASGVSQEYCRFTKNYYGFCR